MPDPVGELGNALSTVQSENPGATGAQLVNEVVNQMVQNDYTDWQESRMMPGAANPDPSGTLV